MCEGKLGRLGWEVAYVEGPGYGQAAENLKDERDCQVLYDQLDSFVRSHREGLVGRTVLVSRAQP